LWFAAFDVLDEASCGQECGSKLNGVLAFFGHGSFRVRSGLRDVRAHGGFAGGKIAPQRMRFHLLIRTLSKFCYSSHKTEANNLDDEPSDLDLSFLVFDEFTAFFFAHEIVPDHEQYGYFLTDGHGKSISSQFSTPEVLARSSAIWSAIKGLLK
jgi:hypothetical protein